MVRNLFQDMVRTKRAGQFKPASSSNSVVKNYEVSAKPEPKIEKYVPPEPKIVKPELKSSTSAYIPKIKVSKPKDEEENSETEFASVYDVSKHNKEDHVSSKGVWFLAICSVLVLLFALSWFFSEAKITIEPKSTDVSLDKNFFSAKGALTNDLAFDLIVVSGEAKKEVSGGGEQTVSESAKGRVIIYNNYSSATQRLDINTRLEGSNGKIYKTEKQIVVPGKKSDGTPGSIEVNVYANEPGEAYNSGPLDFTVFGFKGGPKYSKFYARSKTDMTGGKVGTVMSVSKEVETATLEELKGTLQNDLTQKANGSIPPGFVLFHGATSLNIDSQEINPIAGSSGMVEMKLTGTLYGFLFDEKQLTKKIAETNVPDYSGGEVFIPNIQNLAFTVYDQDALSFKDTKSMTFNLLGDTKVVSKIDENKLLADLMGRSRKDVNQILSSYPDVVSGNISLKPFWRKTLPEKRGDIKLIINYPK